MVSPFRESAVGPAFSSESPAGAAELKLGYAFDHGLDVAVVVGGPGLGKTTLIRRLANRIAAAGHATVDLFFTRLNADGILAFVDEELSGFDPAAAEREMRLRRIAARSRQLAQENRSLAILIDDAHLLRDPAAFETLQLLLNLREREGARLSIALAGQRSLLAELESVPPFSQRISVVATLAPLNEEQTATYVRHRLSAARWDSSHFDADALTAIHRRSNGIPRAINRLCEMSLLVAQSEQRHTVSAADVEALASELPAFNREAA